MLSVVVLITILMLVMASTRLAVQRLDTARSAQFEAFQDATTSTVPLYTGDSALSPIDGTDAIRPTLPNRTHVPRPTVNVEVRTGHNDAPSTVSVGGKAGLVGPAWTFSAYPVGDADRAPTEQWFSDYATESHGSLMDPLRLAPNWTP